MGITHLHSFSPGSAQDVASYGNFVGKIMEWAGRAVRLKDQQTGNLVYVNIKSLCKRHLAVTEKAELGSLDDNRLEAMRRKFVKDLKANPKQPISIGVDKAFETLLGIKSAASYGSFVGRIMERAGRAVKLTSKRTDEVLYVNIKSLCKRHLAATDKAPLGSLGKERLEAMRKSFVKARQMSPTRKINDVISYAFRATAPSEEDAAE